MGFDISYHPIKTEEIKKWYFDALNDDSIIDQVSKEFRLDNSFTVKYKEIIKVGRETDPTESFEKSHGFYVAVIQGLFRQYFYLRGSAFSFLIEENELFRKYTTGWENILDNKPTNPIANKITENYSSGVYISPQNVINLLNDYESQDEVKSTLNKFYSNGHISVFLKALEAARNINGGVLEATEVIEPNPLDLNSTETYSNLFNCDTEGPLLYQATAIKQIEQIEKANNISSGDILNNYEYVKTDIQNGEKTEKKSFWKRLFG